METLPVTPGALTPQDTSAATLRPQPAAVAAALAEAASPVPPDPVQQAVTAARADAAVRQGGLGTLMADLQRALESPALPPGLRAAVGQVLARQLPTDPPITGESLRRAVAESGLFLEARTASAGAAPLDLKAALLMLQQALTAAGARPPARLQRPGGPPPTPDGATSAERPAAPTISKTDDADTLLRHLRGDVEQALARQTLHQLASLPAGGAPHWMFELPLATPQGPAIAQFAIEPDDDGPGADGATAPAWQARFSIDLAPLGPVHVRLRMADGQGHVTFWAEQPDGLDRLRARGAELVRALGGEVAFHAGAPQTLAPPAGQLVDRRS